MNKTCPRCGRDLGFFVRENAYVDDIYVHNYPCYDEVIAGEPLLDGSRWTVTQGWRDDGSWHIPSGLGWPGEPVR